MRTFSRRLAPLMVMERVPTLVTVINDNSHWLTPILESTRTHKHSPNAGVPEP